MTDSRSIRLDQDDSLDAHHYAFHVSDDEFDAIFDRVQQAGLAYGSHPWDAENRKLNDWNGGRGVYFRDPNGHLARIADAALGKSLILTSAFQEQLHPQGMCTSFRDFPSTKRHGKAISYA